MRFIDRVVDNLDALLTYAHKAVWRTNPREFIDLATTDDDETFVTRDGTLVTVLYLKGLTSNLYGEELKSVINEIAEVMGRDIIRPAGHQIAISYEFDPDQAYDYCRNTLRQTESTGKRLGLGSFVSAIVEEKAQKMAEFCQVENTYIALYTTPAAIHKAEMKGQVAERTEVMGTWPDTAEALLNDLAFPQLRVKHRTMVQSFMHNLANLSSLKDVSLLTSTISVRDYLKSAKQITEPGSAPNWAPRIAADFMQDIRVPTNPKRQNLSNADFMMPPVFGEQLFGSIPQTIGLKYAVLGNRIHYAVALSMGPTEPETFDRLVQQASAMRLPFRITFSFTGSGTGVDYLNTALAKTFPWASSANAQVKKAHEALIDYEQKSNGVVPGLYVSACTWAPLKMSHSQKNGATIDLQEITERGTKLNRALQSWGGCQTTDAFAAPIEGALSTHAGLYDHPLGAIMAPPLPDGVGLLPLFRPTTSWTSRDGNVVLRTNDGRFIHYQQTSSRQNAWVTLLVGPMGYGKSTALNTLNLYFLLTPAPEPELPFLRCLDIGPSSRSIIDMLKASLGPDQQHLARYIRIQNTPEYQFNPFDTPLGLEFPLPNHQEFLGNLLMTIAYSMQGDPAVEAQLPGLVSSAISKMFEKYASAKNGGDRAKVFHESGNTLVNEKVAELGIEVDEVSTWHEIRNELFAKGETRAAYIAHRKAMPILQDLIGIISAEEMRDDYPDEVNGIPVLKLFSRAIREAIEMFPMLCGETKFEMGDSRVISLDMEDIVPREQTERAKWKASIAFFVGYDILTRDFFFHEDYVKIVPKQYQLFHARRAKQLKTARKRFSMDERQRFSKIPSAQNQVDSLIAEGRKNLVDIMVASQLFEHHTDQSIKLSSTVVILGAGNMGKEEADMVSTRFDLTPAQMGVIRRIRPPSSRGAEAFMIFRTRDGNQAQHVLMTDGPIYLWLITTEAVDRQMRGLMYEQHGTEKALRLLASKYGGGSIKKELENRMADADDTDGDDENIGDLIQQLANEC